MTGLGEIAKSIRRLKEEKENLKERENKLSKEREKIIQSLNENTNEIEKLKQNNLKSRKKRIQVQEDKQQKLQNEINHFVNSECLEKEEQIENLRKLLDDPPSDSDDFPRLLTLPWNHKRWTLGNTIDAYHPPTKGLAPGVIRLGTLLVKRQTEFTEIPALAPIFNSDFYQKQVNIHLNNLSIKPHILFSSRSIDSRQKVINTVKSVALRVISTFPARKLKCVFIDPINMGDTFPFKDLHRFVAGQKTYTRSDDIEEQLRELTDHIEQVIQNYLGNNYQNIEEYNQAAQVIAEPYRYLFIVDYPAGFSKKSLEDLKSILVNGPKAGVNVVLHFSEEQTESDIVSDIVLDEVPSDKKIAVLKIVRGITGLGLKEAKGLVENPPKALKNVAKEEQMKIKSQLEEAGAKVTVHGRELSVKQENKNFALPTELFGTSVTATSNAAFFANYDLEQKHTIELDQPPPAEQFNQIIQAVTEATKSTQVDTIPFSKFYPEQPWSNKYDTRRGINASIGLKGAKDKLEFWLGENEEGELTSHGLLAGKTGSGKSFTLHAIITSLAMKYSPEELELYLLDFKEGVEFQMYVNSEKGNNNLNSTELKDDEEDNALPHAKVVSIESDREFGLSVLEYINQQIEERSNQFKAAGNLNKLQEYRDSTGEKMPRILVVIDEFQYMFQENDQITRRLNTVMDNITRQGRAFGIHLVIASQSPNVQNMSREIYSQVDLRMVQQMDESTASSILGDGNTNAVDLLDKPGKVIYNKEFGKKNYNEIGQVANISAQERYNALSYIKSVAEENNYQRSEPLVVFNGSQPTNLNQNRQLKQLSEISQWLSLKELNKQVLKEKDWIVQEAPSVAWLGEAMRIGNHTKAIFRSRPRSNMLLVGSSEEIIFGILSGILVGLVHSRKPETAQFKIIDLSIPDEDNYWTEMTTHFRDCFSPYFSIQVAKRFSDQEQQILKSTTLLREVYEEFESRLNKRNENPDEEDFGETIFFIYAIGSLNQAQNLRPAMGRRNREELSEDAEKLSELISQGSELGIHTIIWVEDLKTFLKMTADDRSWLTHFDLRVGLTMSESDSRLMFGETYAQKLSRMRAYFYDDASNYLEKFKPYAVPTKEELSSYSEQFQKRC